jgi:MFS family permease
MTSAGYARKASDSSVIALRSAAGATLIAATVFASMVASLDANVIKVAVPAIGRSLDVSVTELQWTVASYLLTVAALLLLSGTAGPYAGGWLADHASWRAVFLLSIPLILAALLTRRGVPESTRQHAASSLDIAGGLLAVLGLGAVIYALTAGAASGWLSAPVLITAAAGVVSLTVLVPVERRQRAPVLRLSLFASRQCNAINITTVLFYGALGAASYLLVLQCELRLGYSAAQAVAVLIPSRRSSSSFRRSAGAGRAHRPATPGRSFLRPCCGASESAWP